MLEAASFPQLNTTKTSIISVRYFGFSCAIFSFIECFLQVIYTLYLSQLRRFQARTNDGWRLYYVMTSIRYLIDSTQICLP